LSLPTTCALADDFYSHVNAEWNKQTHLPITETRITQAYFIQKIVNDELTAIIQKQKDTSPIGLLLNSWNHFRIPTDLFQSAMAMKDRSDVCRFIGWMNRVGIGAPVSVYTQGDPKDHRKCRIFIEEGSPHIGIAEYWLWPEYIGHRRAYARYVQRLARILGLPNLTKGYAAEREFASVFPPVGQREASKQILTWSDITKEFTTFDWSAFLTAAGYTSEQQRSATYRVTSHPFIHHLQARLQSWSMDRWRGWFVCLLAQWLAGITPHGPLRTAWFDYKRVHLQGMLKDVSKADLRSAMIPMMMPNALGKLWVAEYCNPEIRRAAVAMCERIRNAADRAIAATPWLAASTKAEARHKVRTIRIDVGWPDEDKWKTHEATCALSPTDYVGNLLALGKANSDMNVGLSADCRRPLGDNWSRPVYQVNAFYSPEENRFLLPAAILRPPFWDPRASLTANYGSIGATIGHEISHAFDSDGRNYDAKGNKRDWWTAHDDREYRRRAAEIVRLYESRKYRGMDVNGDMTLVENIADIVGIRFALDGLADELNRPLTDSDLREFFDAYAISWRAKDRRRRAEHLLATDPHAPPMLRVNHVVRMFDEWYDAYGIRKDCAEWIPPKRRVQFFGA